ncbi:MAG: itaconate CoA-transferase [Pseudohongiellaceae bacterium]|jgi:itaconate CoA-transferase
MKLQGPLTGITVLAVEHAIAAPLCTRQLAELGARVIKVERRQEGDFARSYDERVKGLSSHFVWTNRSKQSLTLDLKHPRVGEILSPLIAASDILVQNLAPKAADKMGLSFDALHRLHPKLIVCNISGYGESGPYQNKKAYDLLVQAEAGFLSVTGTQEQEVKSGISIADIAAGTQAHAAILAALIQRSQTGLGSRIDISMLEAMTEWMGFPLNYAYDGALPPLRTGSDHASIYPYGLFTTGDHKPLLIGIQNQREWERFCTHVLSEAELVTDPRFSTNILRSENREALKKIIQTKFDQLNFEALTSLLDEAQIAFARVNTMAEVWDHPQLTALRRFVDIDTPNGQVKSLLPPANNSTFDAALGPVPALGQHTHSILAELGFDSGAIANLVKDKVV